MAIIILAFVPVFSLTGQEGKLFHPLAFTKTFAMFGATIMAVTLVPVLCTYLLGGKFHSEQSNPVMRVLHAIYRPVFERARVIGSNHRRRGTVYWRDHSGDRNRSEFMPPLNEGDVMYMPITDPSDLGGGEHQDFGAPDAILKRFPEVAYAVGKVARADTSTDPAPVNMNETIVHLKPTNAWRSGMTREGLLAEMGRAVQLPGVTNIWTMPISTASTLSTGIRSQVGLKISALT